MRRVRRVIGRGSLSSEFLTPILIHVVLRLIEDDIVTVVLDSTRCVRWELFTIGVVFHGRVLPVAWAVIPYPWPKGVYTPTVINLIQRTLQEWPTNRELHFTADRGFPSFGLFALFQKIQKSLRLGYTIRLRAGDWVTLSDGRRVKIAELMRGVENDKWTCVPAGYQRRGHSSAPANLIIGKSTARPPAHQRGRSDQARREARYVRRAEHLRMKGQYNSWHTDDVWVLLSTASTPDAARAFYARRFHTEGTYRDLKTWHLERVVARENDRKHVEGYTGLAVLAYLIQSVLGALAGCATSAAARARRLEWCTTDRLSIFWVGRQVLHESANTWRDWLRDTGEDLGRTFASLDGQTQSRRRRSTLPQHHCTSPGQSPPTLPRRRMPYETPIPAHS